MNTQTTYIFKSILLALVFCLPSIQSAQAHKVLPGLRLGPVRFHLRAGHRKLPTFSHRGRLYTLGQKGAQYSIYIQNLTGQRLEVVVSVDGRDVVTGEKATHFRRRGYILNPYKYVNITGYRTSIQGVAAFRFSSPPKAYATKWGDSRYALGLIQIAVFHEKRPIAYIPRPHPHLRRHRKGRSTFSKQSPTKESSPATGGKSDSMVRQRRIRIPRRAPKLGTAFGQYKHAPAQYTTFHRAGGFPTYRYMIRYNSCAGFRATGIYTSHCPRYRRPLIQKHRGRFTPPPRNKPTTSS